MSAVKHWILATRPKTLVAAIIPVACATALAIGHTSLARVSLLTAFLALLATICIQIGTNLVNDALDFKKGADTSERLGPIRVTQQGLLAEKTVMKVGLFFFFLAFIFGIPLAFVGGFPIIVIGLLSILFGYCYTGGPYPIAYKGLGELFVFLFFGFAAVCGTYYLLRHLVSLDCVVLSLQIGALASVILAVNNYRDCETDKKVKKMTLAARYGIKFARYEILTLYAFVFLLNLYWLEKYNLNLFMLNSMAIVPAYFVVKGVFQHKPSHFINQYLGLAALTELVFGVLAVVGFSMI